MNIWLHWPAPADGVARKQQESAEGFDLVEFKARLRIANFNPVFLDQKRDEIAAIAAAIALDAANLIKERRQDSRVWVAHAGERIAAVPFHVGRDQRLAFVHRPFVHTTRRIVDIPIKKGAVIGVIHDLTDGRAGAFRDDPIDHTFAFGHPSAGKTHKFVFKLPAYTRFNYSTVIVDQ